MKSKRAEETIQSVRFTLTEPLGFTALKYVNTQLVTAGIASMAVHQAEQDAEERAVAVAEDFFKEWKDVPIQDWMITEFKEKLNGGQSDENN